MQYYFEDQGLIICSVSIAFSYYCYCYRWGFVWLAGMRGRGRGGAFIPPASCNAIFPRRDLFDQTVYEPEPFCSKPSRSSSDKYGGSFFFVIFFFFFFRGEGGGALLLLLLVEEEFISRNSFWNQIIICFLSKMKGVSANDFLF